MMICKLLYPSQRLIPIFKWVSIFLFLIMFYDTNAQLAEVQANYNSVGDVEFVAYNNSKAPLFLKIDLADLEFTSFREALPFVKQIEPGFNNLFVLERDLDAADVPRFHYEIDYYRSNPIAVIDLEFPYLIPFEPGLKINTFNVKSIKGFLGLKEPESWSATGLETKPGEKVYASRNGIVVEIAGDKRNDEPQTWYNGWNNSITVLQTDGTLACYRNVVDNNKNLKVGRKIYAGQLMGEIAPNASELIFLVYNESIISDDLIFIIPQFVIAENEAKMLIFQQELMVVHPEEIIGMEMTEKEKRKFLK